MTRLLTTLLVAAMANSLGAQQPATEPAGPPHVRDEATGLTVYFPPDVGTVTRHDVSMSEKTDGRDRFPRFSAATRDGVRLEASLVPYPPERATANPQARLSQLTDAMVRAVGGEMNRREFSWAGGFAAVDVAFVTSGADPSAFRARLVLYRRDVALFQAIGADMKTLNGRRFERFFEASFREGAEAPESYLHRTARYDFSYPPGARLTDLDDGILVETADGAVYIRAVMKGADEPLAALAALLGEEVARRGPVEVRAGPRLTGSGTRRCASMTLAPKSRDASDAERIVRYYSHSDGRLLVTATRRPTREQGAPSQVDLVISSFEVTVREDAAGAVGSDDDD